MPKHLLQDIVVKTKRAPAPVAHEMEMRRKDVFVERVKQVKKEGKRHRYALWLVASVSILFLLFAISYFFLKVTIKINPKIQDIVLNKNLSAIKNGSGDILLFDLMSVSGEEQKTIESTGTKDVSEKAQGTVIIYNAFGPASQLLSIDTRLEGSNGKIYKTKKRIIVPGMKDTIPGSIEVDIYGAEAGEEYNSAPLDFTVFGFRGTPKYSKFYARSKGPIVGGFKGKSPFVSSNQELSLLKELRTTLQAKLFKKATDQIPNGFILFKDAVFLITNPDDDASINSDPSKENKFVVKQRGTLYGFLFNEAKLTKKIAQDSIEKYDGSPVYIPNIKDLIFSLSGKENFSSGEIKNIDFNLSGNAQIVWKLDEAKFKADLLGKSKKDFSQILLQYPNIISADLAISPFWKNTLPDKSKDIKVIVNYPK